MTRTNPFALPALVAAAFLLAGCASIPSDFEQIPSRTWQEPESTQLGEFFARYAPDDPELSGVRLVEDPKEAFQARFGFAALAEKTLDLQYYLWKGDLAGQLLLYRCFEAADRGVQVRILIDDIYHSKRDIDYATIDSHPHMQIRVYNPIGTRGTGKMANFVYRKGTLNHRMHNKIFLADSAVAVLGGRNIGNDYFGVDPKLNFVDLDVLAVGPAARAAGVAFDDYWNSPASVPIAALINKPLEEGALKRYREDLRSSLDELHALPYTVPYEPEEIRESLEQIGRELTWARAEVIVDSLERFQGGSESVFVELTDRLVEEAESEFVIQTAYLIPSKEGVAQIEELTDRGVRVRFLTNSLRSTNHATVHSHYKKYRKPMIEAGAELHELQANPEILQHYKQVEDRVAESHAGLHTKAFVMDRRLTMIGSYNMDPRSRIWNSEIGLLIHSVEFAEKTLEVMEVDFAPANSWNVTIREGGKKLQWTGIEDGELVTYLKEPGTSGWQRFTTDVMRAIPMEKEL